MPWLLEAMKDVISCDKLGRGANNHLNPRFPNGATQYVEGVLFRKEGERGELKHLSTLRRRKQK